METKLLAYLITEIMPIDMFFYSLPATLSDRLTIEEQFKEVLARVCGVAGDCFGSAEVAGRDNVLQRMQRPASDSFGFLDDRLQSFFICTAAFVPH